MRRRGAGAGVVGRAAARAGPRARAAIKRDINAAGLELEAIENFDPAHWHDVLLDGPKKQQHLENVKTLIRRLGQAGIPIMGYNFSLAGVCGRTHAPYARGGAMSVGMEGPMDTPMPNGMVWNMVYDGSIGAGAFMLGWVIGAAGYGGAFVIAGLSTAGFALLTAWLSAPQR